MSATSRSPGVARLRARVVRERAEIAAAEAWCSGASGVEERDEEERPDEVTLIIYAPLAAAEAVRAALGREVAPEALGPIEPVADEGWPETWKAGLAPVVVSERLVVRPPFAAHALAPGQSEIVIEPRQAFGTGTHASTALALETLDAARARLAGVEVLDVGCGSGVLALAALRLGAAGAVALDLDPIAARETAENAAGNGLAGRVRTLAGPVEALGDRRFGAVVANLLRRELEPILGALVDRLGAGGVLVLSGLLEAERGVVTDALAGRGARVVAVLGRTDERGDAWLALTATR